MAKQLTLDELINCARACEPDGGRLRDMADSTAKTIELLTKHLADYIARELSIYSSEVKFDLQGMDGMYVDFFAKRIGQCCPSPLAEFGNNEWSLQSGKALDIQTGNEMSVPSKWF